MTTTTATVDIGVASRSKVTIATIEEALDEGILECKNPEIIPDGDFIYIVIVLKDLAAKDRIKPFNLHLTNPLHTPSSIQTCLIIDDRPSSKLNKKIVKKFIQDQLIPITKVLTFSKLQLIYKSGRESTGKLAQSYDLFLMDKRVRYYLTPSFKKYDFLKKNKLPVMVDLTVGNWGEQLEKACRTAILHIKSRWCSMKVAKLSMPREEIVKNISEGIEGVVKMIPGNWGGIYWLDLKFGDYAQTIRLALYESESDASLKIEGVEKDDLEMMERKDEIEKIEDSNVGKKRKKGISLMEDEIEKIEDSNVGKKRKKGISLMEGVEGEGRGKVSKEKEAKWLMKQGHKEEKRKMLNEESLDAILTEVGEKLQLHNFGA